jgi:hypothetical protein
LIGESVDRQIGTSGQPWFLAAIFRQPLAEIRHVPIDQLDHGPSLLSQVVQMLLLEISFVLALVQVVQQLVHAASAAV